MAIPHFDTQMIQRSKGGSAVRAAAYAAREKLHDEKVGLTFSFTRLREDLKHSEIMAPESAPSWVFDRQTLWNRAEAKKHKNYQPARSFVCALPTELDLDQQKDLVRRFIRDALVSQGRVADFAIHCDEDGVNPHVHIVTTTAEILEDRFGRKLGCEGANAWKRRRSILEDEWRAGWEEATNRALARAGHDVQISLKSFAEQGIDLEPTKHLGLPVGQTKTEIPSTPTEQKEAREKDESPKNGRWDGRLWVRDAAKEHKQILARNGNRALQRPETALDALARSQGTFTRRDMASYLAGHMDAERISLALDKVANSEHAIFLGRDHDGADRFTTKRHMETEAETLQAAIALSNRNTHQVSQEHARAPSLSRQMGREQEAAYRYLTQESGDIAVVQGYAGAGKTYILGAAKEAWEAQGFRVVGAALAAKAAQGLEAETGIKSRTLASMLRSLDGPKAAHPEAGRVLNTQTVLVIDEAGMAGTYDLHRLLGHAEAAGCKVVLTGDVEQLQAVEAGAMMRAIAERVGEVVIAEVRRQSEGWQREATRQMGRGETREALEAYEQAGHFVKCATKQEAIASMLRAWREVRAAEPEDTLVMLAHERADVAALNAGARWALVESGKLEAGIEYATTAGKRFFAKGDRLVFLKNDRELGVRNGQAGVVQSVGSNSVVVKLDGGDAREVRIEVSRYGHFDHGYAVTVHKAQGETVDRCLVLASQYFDSNLIYVAMSRHREDVRLFWSEEVFGSKEGLIEGLSRAPTRSTALDYVLAHDLQDGELRGPFWGTLDEQSIDAQRAEFIRDVEALSDAELADWRERLVPDAERELAKPADMAPPAEAERLQKLSAEVDLAHERWIEASDPYHELRQAFIDERAKSASKDGTTKPATSKEEAERLWESKGRHSREARRAFKAMTPAFDAREKAIARLQKLQRRSRVAQKAAEAAREHNLDVRRSRDMLHLVEREIDQRRITELQRELDATEFNLTQRLRMWNDASHNRDADATLRAYTNDGPLKGLWADLRVEERLASSARYELSGMVATRGAWFAPLETLGEPELPADRQGLAQMVDATRQSYQEALRRWGLWRAEHSIAEAHAARRGEGEGAAVYRDYVLADRRHGRAQRAYMDRVVREEIGRAESTHLEAAQAWEIYRTAHPQEARDAYKGDGEAGRLWKAERQTYDELSRWEAQYDWRNQRGRHHVFPQPESAGMWQKLRHRETYALQLAAEWEAYKSTCSAEQLEEARHGKGEGGELYEQYRVAHRERQHTRHEVRITSTEKELRRTELQGFAAHDKLFGHLKELPSIEQAIGDRGQLGALWREHQELDAERQDLEQRLDKLLGIKRSFEQVDIPTGQELLDAWLDAETAVAETGKAWQTSLVQGEALRSRRGVGEDAGVYEAYREAIARRDALRLPVVRGLRIHQLDTAERNHLKVLERSATKAGDDVVADELYGAHQERLRCQALLDEVAPWQPVHLHPQPEATAERIQTVQERFATALRDWVAYKDAHGQSAVVQVYKGEADERGRAVFDTYRQAGIEYQHVQHQMRIDGLEAELARVERDYGDVHGALFGRLKSQDAVTRAMTEHGEEGALWKRREELEAEREELEQQLDGLLGVQRPQVASERTTALPQDVELGRQWYAAEEAITKASAAWAEVPEGERRQARRAGLGEHAEVYGAYRAALDRRDLLREPLVHGVRSHELEQATERHVEAARMVAASPGEEGRLAAELEAKAEWQRLAALLGKTASADERVAGRGAEALALAPPGQADAPEWDVEQRHWLSVPYAEREQAKAAGAQWSEEARCWYAPAGADLSPLSLWLPQQTQGMRDPRQEFAEALRSAGLVLDGEPIMDGQFHRVPVEGAKRGARDGAYVGHIGGTDAGDRSHGYCKNHKTGEERSWSALGTVPLSREQRAEIEQQKQESGLERDLRHARRAAELKELWRDLPAAEHDHPYLAKKGVVSHGLKQDEHGSLVMPLRDADGDLWSLQRIDVEGAKRLATGGRKSGCFHLIGELQGAEEVLVCEGYATGASLHQATGKPVVVAIDAGNLKPVAEALRESHPQMRMVVMADNDHNREVNVGVEKATEAAKAVDGAVVVPRLTESERSQGLTDWNDIHSARGLAGLEDELREHFEKMKQTRAEHGLDAHVTQVDRSAAREKSSATDKERDAQMEAQTTRPLSPSQQRRVEGIERPKDATVERNAPQLHDAQQLEDLWRKLPHAEHYHPYLLKTAVACHGLKEASDGSLVVPLRDPDGNIQSLQFIAATGEKHLVGRERMAGCFHTIGDLKNAERVSICEDYATGASVYRATLKPVVVAVEAENLKAVAEAVRELCPKAEIVIAADNDHHREVNVGVEKAIEAAKAVDGVVVVPRLKPAERTLGMTSWNDIQNARGFPGLRREIRNQLEAHQREQDRQKQAGQDREKGDREITR